MMVKGDDWEKIKGGGMVAGGVLSLDLLLLYPLRATSNVLLHGRAP